MANNPTVGMMPQLGTLLKLLLHLFQYLKRYAKPLEIPLQYRRKTATNGDNGIGREVPETGEIPHKRRLWEKD